MRSAWSLFVAVLVSTTAAPLAADPGTIRGRVTAADGAPLAGAAVVLEATGVRALTDGSGTYRLPGVTPGSYTMHVRLIGYRASTAQVAVRDGVTLEHDVVLVAVAIGLAPIDVVVGSRARHSTGGELAVPVDIFDGEQIAAQGSSETSDVLAHLEPSVVFPRQSISDGTDVVRPFVLRGLAPDHTLVLLNGKRRHATALVHVFGVALGAGSSGVDLNAIPASAIERIEVLRDGAAAQYGSDAIAGVVNVVLKDGAIAPYLSATTGRYAPAGFPSDGGTADVAGGWGFSLGRGSVTLLGEYRTREPTNRAGADPYDQITPGDADITDPATNRLLEKRNPVPQPTYHWGDGAAHDLLGVVNARLPLGGDAPRELYGFGGVSTRRGSGNGFRRTGLSTRNWPEIYPLGYLPEFDPDVVDLSAAVGLRGITAGWAYDASASYGASKFEFNLTHTLNASLGPCLTLDPAVCTSPPLGPDSIPASGDEIPNQTAFFAGALRRREWSVGFDLRRSFAEAPAGPVTLALGAALRREGYQIVPGEPASYVQGWHPDRNGDPAPSGSQVFPGFRPSHAADAWRSMLGLYTDLEAHVSREVLADAAARMEHSAEFGQQFIGKLALRYHPRPWLALRGAGGTGFRAPGLSQSLYASTVTNFDPTTGTLRDVAIFPVNSAGARALGAQPLRPETSKSLSIGAVLQPAPMLSITLDGFYIAVQHRIMLTSELGGPAIVSLLGAAGENEVVAARFFANALNTNTRGLDVAVRYMRQAAGRGWLTVSGACNITTTHVSGTVGPVPGTTVSLLDESGINAVTGERPRWQARLTGEYRDGRWSALARANLYGRYRSSVWSFSEFQEYGDEVLVDLEVGRAFHNGVRVRVGVRNVFDNFPDRTGPANSFGIMQWPSASPFGFNGRYVYARLDTRLGG